LSVGLKIIFFKDLKNPYLVVLIYLSFHYTDLEFNVIRQGLAISLIFLAFKYSEKNKFNYFIFVTLATLIHVSSILFYPFYFIYRIREFKINYSKVIIVIISAFAIRLFFVENLLSVLSYLVNIPQILRIKNYLALGNFVITLGCIKRMIIIILYLLLNKEKQIKSKYFFLYLISFFVFTIFMGNDQLAHRASLCFEVFAIPMFGEVKIKYNIKNCLILLVLFLVLFLTYFENIRLDDRFPYQTYLFDIN
jgi:hypothetical protein